MTFKEVRLQSGMTMMQFSKYFKIPYRTVQDWEYEKRKCPSYLLYLIEYKLNKECKIKEQD